MSEERAGYNISPLGMSAVDYARRGYWVFPLEPQGKKPLGRLVPHGLTQASNDPAVVADWWRRVPNANIGLSCGPSKLVVIDVDPRHGGDESIRDLLAKYPEMDDTLTGETGGGGWHLCFAAPAVPIANSTGSLAPGLDVRGVGGYIVVPPSIHPDGKAYEWMAGYGIEDKQPARLPLPLVEALTTSQDGADAPVDVAAVLGGVGEGERDWQLFRLAAKLRYADIPIDWAYRLVGEAAAACVPVFPADEARKKVDSAYRYHAGKVAITMPADEERPEVDDSGRFMLGQAIIDGIPEPEWVIDKVLLKGMVCLMYGVPGCGKTLLMVGLARDLVAEKRHVLFLDEENGPNMIGQRFDLMGADPSLLDEYLHYFPFTGFSLEDMPKLDAYVDRVRPELIVMDSFGALLSASRMEENNNDHILQWMAAIPTYLARKYGCAVVIVDHITKEGKTEYSIGGGAKKRAADYQWLVSQVSPFDAQTLGQLKLEEKKNRMGVLPASHLYDAGGMGGRLIVRPYDPMAGSSSRTLTQTQERVLKALKENRDDEGMDIHDVRIKADRSERAARSALKELIQRGLVEAAQADKKVVYFPVSLVTYNTSAPLQTSANRKVAMQIGDPPYYVGGSGAVVDGEGTSANPEDEEIDLNEWD